VYLDFEYKGSPARIYFDDDEPGSLVRALEAKLISLTPLYPELLDEPLDRLFKIPEDDEAIELLESTPGFAILDFGVSED